MRFTKNRIKIFIIFLLICAIGSACSQQEKSTLRQYDSLTIEQHKKLLTKRVLANLDLMVKQDYAKQYDYYDPVFRAHVARDEFIRSRSPNMHYSKPDVRDIKIRGRIADVTVAVTIEIRQLKLPGGRVLDRPPQQRVMPERWLWMDGDWYREYKNGEQSFIRY